MKIMFYDSKPYDKIWFQPMGEEMGFQLKFQEIKLNEDTAVLARNYDAVCIFVNDDANPAAIRVLKEVGVRTILLRCSGFNNVDLKAAQEAGIQVLRVPSYSPEAVAEYAMGLLLAVNRQIHRAYVRTRDFNYNINGLMGIDLVGKTAGVIGTGKIGQMMIDILKGFKMRILAYDPYPVEGLGVEYVELDRLFEQSDVITLHCPLTKDTRHIINKKSISKMKDGVILVNTSRGALIHTPDLIDALMERKFTGVGLDVYEEEDEYFFEDKSNEIIQDEDLIRLTSFRNVVLTSHQAFFTRDAMEAIARVTLENARAVEEGRELVNLVLP
ncbi:MAG: 2-hydroxyacid dehydrogenase [Bacteroides sp.]|nr:2-hydroxyacid dehydrogenase [Bacteroides sp.]MCM1549456.1 2-hydroxyacid dehydrogenase [Clostridium sp.]